MGVIIALFWLALLTFVPGLEARASIPFAFFNGDIRGALGLPVALLVCLATNILVGIVTFWIMAPIVMVLRRWGWFERVIWPFLERTRHKLHPYVERYGEWGLMIFIGVPLPGTGAYSGALGAFLIGLNRRRFLIANALGVLLACIAVSAICILIERGVVGEDSLAGRIFIKRSLVVEEGVQ